MDAGVNELEFSTLRSMRSGVNGDLSNIDQQQDTLATAAAATQQPHSRQVSSQGTRHTASETVAADGLPREVLVAPPQPLSNLELDNASLAHLQKLIKQSVENVGLQERTWEVSLLPSRHLTVSSRWLWLTSLHVAVPCSRSCRTYSRPCQLKY